MEVNIQIIVQSAVLLRGKIKNTQVFAQSTCAKFLQLSLYFQAVREPVGVQWKAFQVHSFCNTSTAIRLEDDEKLNTCRSPTG